MTEVDAALTAAFRTEWARLVATLIGGLGDWDLAEECAQEAFALAWRTWPRDGVPERPGAWLLTAARRRAVDRLRRERVGAGKLRELARTEIPDAGEAVSGTDIPDDRLRLIFTCCHPALAFEAQVALALRTLTGLTTAEIARAFGVPEPTMAKRLVRAKQKIRDAGIPYRVPPAHLLPERTTAVLGVIYLLFNEGYLAGAGPDLQRPDLAAEARRLAALVVELMPDDPEAGGLNALVLLQQSRAATRTLDGVLVPLEEQDRGRWDRELIAAGLAELRRAARRDRLGPYQLQAMIVACHVTAADPGQTDWARIAELYDGLWARIPSPTVAVNRAIAVAMRSGPEAGLALLDSVAAPVGSEVARQVTATRADLLRRLGRSASAAIEYRAALDLTANAAERDYLRRRLAEVEG
ncbi:RNA polymerase sigma factor [Nocardia sp. NPDC004340]